MANKYEVQFFKEYTHILKGDIEVRDINGIVVKSIPAPDHTLHYPVGKRVFFSKKNDARDFVACHAEYCHLLPLQVQ